MPLILDGTNGISDVRSTTDGSAATPAIRGTDANTGIFFPAADTIAFGEGGAEVMRIDASGNVGIGTSSPSTPLNIVRNAGGAQKVLFSNNSSGSSAETAFSVSNGTAEGSLRVAGSSYGGYGAYTANNTLVYNDTSAITIMADNASNGIIKFATGSNSERMRISSAGGVYINCVNNPSTSTVGGAFVPGVSTSGLPTWMSSTGTTGNAEHAYFYNPNGLVGFIRTNGSTTTYSTSSDYRLKENIAPMTGALATVAQLKPVTYKWKVDGSDGQGFIAHELQAVVPDCVSGEKDAVDADGNPKHQGIDTSFLVATLTAAIQEQQAIINDLKSRIETLEST